MVRRVFAAAAAMLMVACSPALADPMTIDFSWQGAKGCITLFPNPEIRLRNVPPGGKLLLLTLEQGTREMGGQEIPLPENGILPPGAIRTFAPCRPAIYRWTAVVKSATGKVLAEAREARFYPTDEPAPEKP